MKWGTGAVADVWGVGALALGAAVCASAATEKSVQKDSRARCIQQRIPQLAFGDPTDATAARKGPRTRLFANFQLNFRTGAAGSAHGFPSGSNPAAGSRFHSVQQVHLRIRMPKRTKIQSGTLKGWQQISTFLGEPLSVVQRWAQEGMPVHKEGRYVSTSPDELNAWLGRQSGKPVHAATVTTDLTSELKRGLSYIRHENQAARDKKPK